MPRRNTLPPHAARVQRQDPVAYQRQPSPQACPCESRGGDPYTRGRASKDTAAHMTKTPAPRLCGHRCRRDKPGGHSEGPSTRSHPELGRENPQRRWYCRSSGGRVGRRQAPSLSPSFQHASDRRPHGAGMSPHLARHPPFDCPNRTVCATRAAAPSNGDWPFALQDHRTTVLRS